MRNLIFWTSLPILFPQALQVRRSAPRFEAAQGEPWGRVPGPTPRRLIAIGDSIVAGVGINRMEDALVGSTARSLGEILEVGVDWFSLGRTGLTSSDVLEQLVPLLDPEPADFIMVSVGVNDITSLRTLRGWRRSLNALLMALHRHSPEARIAMAGVPPMQCFPLLPQPLRQISGLRSHSFDQVARRVIQGLDFAAYTPFDKPLMSNQFAPDGYHPGQEACIEFGQTMAHALLRR